MTVATERTTEVDTRALSVPANRVFYPALDGLRAIAVLMVFSFHYPSGLNANFMSFGWAGVDLFFVLSGFLITGILYDTRHEAQRVRNFYGRRTLRIFPLYFGIFALLALTTPLLHWDWNRSWLLWLSYLGELPHTLQLPGSVVPPNWLSSATLGWKLSFAHFWSLCVEEQFYLLWPALVFLVRDRVRLRNLCLMAIVCVPLLRTVCLLHGPALHAGLYATLPFRADALLLGGAAALALRGPEGRGLQAAAPRILAAAGAAWLAVWGIAVAVLHQPGAWLPETPWITAVGYTIVDVMAIALVLLALEPGTKLYRWLNVRPLRRIGQISYGIYVFHQIPAALYSRAAEWMIGRHTSHTGPLMALLAAIGSYTLASLSFRYLESPFLRLKHRFEGERNTPPSSSRVFPQFLSR